jgi:hypothetical protein
MMQDVQEKLRPGLLWQKQQEDSQPQQIRLRAKEETNEVLHLEHGFVWRGNLDSAETRS